MSVDGILAVTIPGMQRGNAHGPDPEHSRIPTKQKTLALLARGSDNPVRAYTVLSEYSSKATTARERAEFNARIGMFFGNIEARIPYSVDNLVMALEGRSQPHDASMDDEDDPFREFARQAIDYRELVGGMSGRRLPQGELPPDAELPLPYMQHLLRG